MNSPCLPLSSCFSQAPCAPRMPTKCGLQHLHIELRAAKPGEIHAVTSFPLALSTVGTATLRRLKCNRCLHQNFTERKTQQIIHDGDSQLPRRRWQESVSCRTETSPHAIGWRRTLNLARFLCRSTHDRRAPPLPAQLCHSGGGQLTCRWGNLAASHLHFTVDIQLSLRFLC